jgi:hypothetical protein
MQLKRFLVTILIASSSLFGTEENGTAFSFWFIHKTPSYDELLDQPTRNARQYVSTNERGAPLQPVHQTAPVLNAKQIYTPHFNVVPLENNAPVRMHLINNVKDILLNTRTDLKTIYLSEHAITPEIYCGPWCGPSGSNIQDYQCSSSRPNGDVKKLVEILPSWQDAAKGVMLFARLAKKDYPFNQPHIITTILDYLGCPRFTPQGKPFIFAAQFLGKCVQESLIVASEQALENNRTNIWDLLSAYAQYWQCSLKGDPRALSKSLSARFGREHALEQDHLHRIKKAKEIGAYVTLCARVWNNAYGVEKRLITQQ